LKFLENLSLIPKRTEVLLSIDIRKVSKEIFVDNIAGKLNGLNKKHLGLTFRCAPSLHFIELDNLCKSLSNSVGCLKYLNIYDHSGDEIYNNENASSSLLFDFNSNSNSSSSCFILDIKSEERDENQIDEESDEEEEDDYFDMEDVFDDGFDDIIDEDL